MSLTNEQTAKIVEEIIKPTLAGAGADGFPIRGILFLGLMMTDSGPKVLEYNVRFGDPVTRAGAVAVGRSDPIDRGIDRDAEDLVVVAPGGCHGTARRTRPSRGC